MLRADDAAHEARTLARRVKALLESGQKPGDVAVLYRSVRTSAGPLIQAFIDERIPASVVGRVSLLDRPETRLVARAFVLMAEGTWYPDDEAEVITRESLARELRELSGVSPAEAASRVMRVAELGEELVRRGVKDLAGTYMAVLRLLGLPCGPDVERQERGLGAISSLLVDFEHAVRRSVPEGAMDSIAMSGVAVEAAEEATMGTIHDSGAERGQQAGPPAGVSIGAGPGPASLGSPPGAMFLTRLRVFLERFAAQAVEETSEGAGPVADAVNVMTIHQAKGLEFPVVIVPSLVQGRFPSSKTGRPKDWYVPGDRLIDKARYEGKIEDERRLFYVAMTRAKELLILSTFANHKTRHAAASQFLRDLAACPDAREQLSKLGTVKPRAERRPNGAVPDAYDCSQLLVYSECPRKYYLRYGCGFAPPIDPALGFGKMAHHVVCEMARRCMGGELPCRPWRRRY